jgi:serine/threonine-protein kinase
MEETSQSPPQRRVVAGRYELHDLLGSGGMGRVYRAHDTRLRRTIALKLLIGGGAEADQRLLQEAQSQARVEHEHVCRVYEVGWGEGGEPFIVMQLIEGEALCDVAPRLSFEQRARLVLQVSEAVHAANRLGVIHRDLKPGNVLVEQTLEGQWKPYVTDFGLARDVTLGARQTGSVVGTPQYMAPEQARGETARIDRRTDVYGLGATLYEVLSGKLPFDGAPYSVLEQVLRDDPKPLRRLDPAIPRDLAAISRKCMEKDPDQRYDSARALAEDLQRWLDGEPIVAEPPSISYRLQRKITRHRTLALVLAGVFLASILATVFAIRARSRAREMAEQFGQEVKEIEGRMRFALVLPLHDISDEEAVVRVAMNRIEQAMRPLGKEGLGPGHYALGRGALALGDHQSARAHFQKAWDADYRTPECATGLGLSLVALYREQLQEVSRIPDKQLRERRRSDLAQKYRTPAKAALRAGEGASTEPAEYVEALIRYCDEDLQGAERAAEAALLQAPWLYEARILLGQIHRERGLRRRAAGDDAGAVAAFDKAQGHLQVSVQFGRSDPRAWGELCALLIDEVALQLSRGASDRPPTEAFSACDDAIAAAPGRSAPYSQAASAWRTWAEAQLRQGRDPTQALERAVLLARRALQLRAGDADALAELGRDLLLRSEHLSSEGRDAGETLAEAVSSLRKASSDQPDRGQLQVALGTALAAHARLQLDREQDAAPALAEASELLTRARDREPDWLAPQAALARVRLLEAEAAAVHGDEQGLRIDEAVRLLQAVAGATQAPGDFLQLAQSYVQRARLDLQEAKDPSASVQWALAALEKVNAEERRWPEASVALGAAWLVMAQEKLRHAEDPASSCAQVRNALADGRVDGPAAAQLSAEADLVEARFILDRTPAAALPLLSRAEQRLKAVLARGGRLPRLERRLTDARLLREQALAAQATASGRSRRP